MRYAQIREIDIANGPGVRASLYVQGCNRHCPGCFNEETWDFCGGKEFTKELEDKLIAIINRPHIVGFTILGGEPMEPEHRQEVSDLLARIRENCPGKTIWMYSSFLYEELADAPEHPLDNVDVLIDGPYVAALSDRKLKFRGSSNQRIIDLNKTRDKGEVLLYEFQKI